MIPLLIFIALGLFILVLYEVREYQKRKHPEVNSTEQTAQDSDDECCGEHLVCERDSLLQRNAEVEYYEDEELDGLANRLPETYSQEEYTAIREVFDTLKEKDVAGWVRSLQLRNIALPLDIREEALLIVRERRNK